ncbi:MAG: HAMP domain-containing sensor histidine kinase [Legionellales bacterium]|nr:HAMP domain-containing sensor histidine kinase [Legionellales bacterium]
MKVIPLLQSNDRWSRLWIMLLIYNTYRLVNIVVLSGLFLVSVHVHANKSVFFSALFIYLLYGLLFLYACFKRIWPFQRQVLWSGTIDTVVMVWFIYVIGYLQSGVGILLSVPIALLSMLVPGRLSIFFAAVASCMLLAFGLFQYEVEGQQSINIFFYMGMYGILFFATSLTACYFVHWVRLSERLARQQGKELITMQRLNEYIVGRLQHGVIFVDANKRIQLMNQAARQFFNHPVEAPEMALYEFSSPLYQKYMSFLSKKNRHNSDPLEMILEKPYLKVHFLPTSKVLQPAVLIILDDMGLIAQQAQQLKLAALGRFSATIAHELRNPLGIILHAVQLLDESQHLNEEEKRLNELAINNCKRMNTVIQNVLHVSRSLKAKPESISLAKCLEVFKHDFCLINRCDIVLKITQNRKKTVYFDKGHLEQILVILCDNAMQHGRDQQGEVHLMIEVKQLKYQMVLFLSDTGPGISSEIREDVFEPFFSTHVSGHGMGLFIAKDLCEINQASLSIMDRQGGCCFALSFNAFQEIHYE